MRILLAEDQKDLNRILVKKLESEGYCIDSCHDGLTAMEYLECAKYDAAILDIMMPGADGFQVLKWIRETNREVPVLFLTARDSVEDRVKGLDLGADDYLVKPFSFEELMARIRVITRKKAGKVTNVYTLCDLTVDVAAHVVKRGEKVIELSAREFSLLEYLIRNQGQVMSRDKIENNIWNYEYAGGTNIVDVYIRYLRRSIDEGYEKKLIHTVRGSGYVLRE